MGLIVEFFNKKIDELDKKGVCIRMLGDLRQVPELQRKTAEAAMARTAHNAGLKLNIALNYGSRQEIVRAARLLAQKCRQGEMRPEDIDENAFEDALYTRGLPPVDLLIRTSGRAAVQLPALSVRVRGVPICPGVLAGLHAGGLCAGARDVFRPRQALWQGLKPGRPRNEKGLGSYMQKRVITGLLASAYVITMILLGKTALVINVVLLLLVGTYEILQS